MKCQVCKLALPAVVGPTTCEACLARASENRQGLHGRGPQEWQRKVDVVVDLCSLCNEPAHASETDDRDFCASCRERVHIFRCSRCPQEVKPWEPLCPTHRAEMLTEQRKETKR